MEVLAGGAIAGPLRELGAQFERASGHTLVFRFGTTPELIELATAGKTFDLAVVPRDVFLDTAAKARFVPGPTTDIARVGIGVAVRVGAPKPDIGTPEALKQTLLGARSIACIPESATGYQVARVFERLGVSEAMKAKMKPQGAPAQVVQAVASGEVELGVFVLNVLMAPGLEVVGPFPSELQQHVVFTSAIAANARHAEAAQAFMAFLMTSAAAAVFEASGMEPFLRQSGT